MNGVPITYTAKNRKTGELVTAKCFLKEHPLFASSEPEALRKLDAPPLPRFIAEYGNERMRCVLREYIRGESLAECCERQTMDSDRARETGIALCGQLKTLHEARIIHRDVKPQNIILREDGKPVLIDFGIARVSTEKQQDTVLLGTQGFAPPEQYGFARTDERSDIYSLGMLLHWMLHGNTEPPKSAETPLEKVILRMTSFDPEKRYGSAEKARKALEGTRPQKRRRQGFRIGIAAVMSVAILALGILGILRGRTERIPFLEPMIEKAARLNLGLGENEPLTRKRLEDVRGIYIAADTACASADEFFPAVNRWYMETEREHGQVKSLEDLRMMPFAEEVCVAGQQLTDISALAGLENLRRAELKHNEIEDISPLSGLKHLTSVGINDNPVQDIRPLLDCPALAFLDLCDVRNYDPTVIGELGNLDYLDLSNPTDSYRYLGTKAVLGLRLSWTGLSDLKDLAGITRLEELEIDHTAVSDLTPLQAHTGLKKLNLTGTPVTDLSPLENLPSLETVTLSRYMKPLAEKRTWSFEIQYQ